jgi:hypothetical protein
VQTRSHCKHPFKGAGWTERVNIPHPSEEVKD